MIKTFTIGTRGSKLALFQSNLVKELLEKNHPEYNYVLKKIKTKGDILIDKALDRKIDKGFFVNEIQKMLINEEIHIAVHSLKDLPVDNNENLSISAILKRANPQDVFISNNKKRLKDFTNNEVIGSSSLRRKAQLLKLNPKLNIVDIRGNIDTRIKKMESGEYDGLVLAAAGVERLGLEKYITEFISELNMLNAPGQGAIAVEIKKNNQELKNITTSINDEFSKITTSTERSFMKLMGGGCNYPIAALSKIKNNKISIEGLVISLDGTKHLRSFAEQDINNWHDLGIVLSKSLYNKGAQEILNEIDNENS
jgi:hydroxymethylbilane synthase|tara:strand:+ start:206 stop:1138 length:933 start_codon:yes stop_codon:yes gene_type:complete